MSGLRSSKEVRSELEDFISAMLCTGTSGLDVHTESRSTTKLLAAVYQWSRCLGRDISEVIRGVEPSLRQSMLMTLLPAKALRTDYSGSYDAAIEEHLRKLQLTFTPDEVAAVRDLIINIRKLQGLSSEQARTRTAGLASVKGSPHYARLRQAQKNRCCWCGVPFDQPDVIETLEHLIPKHLGDDPSDGSNWALACDTCNNGKGDAWAWSATPWAHDYVQRNQFVDPDILEPNHRWVVLRRTARCDSCGADPLSTELVVYRRVQTGLAIPANCSTTCLLCAVPKGREILPVRWSKRELSRGTT